MKGRSLFGFMVSLTVLGAGALAKPQSTIAEPAPIFRPILRDLQNQLPRGMVMRLPSMVNISDNRLYSQVITTIPGEFAVFLNSQPDCKARACQFGIITVAKDSEYANRLRSSPIFSRAEMERVRAIRQRDYQTRTESEKRELIRSEMAVLDRSPITLKQGIQGLFIITNSGGASTPPSLHVIWKQDGLNFRASRKGGLDRDGNVIQRQKSDLINLAILMANEPPIKSDGYRQSDSTVAQSRQTIQSLPDGDYLYGEVSYPNQGGRKYVIFRKSGNVITGLEYTRNTDALSCFQGSVNSNIIANATIAEWPEPDPRSSVRVLFSTGKSIDLSRLYRINGFDSQVSSTASIRKCNQVFADRPGNPNQTVARRAPSPVQTYRDTRALGMAQFLQGKQELISAHEKLQLAVQGKYDIVEIPKSDFLEDKFTDVAESPGTFLGKRNDVSYGDYLKLKLKLKAQEKLWDEGIDIVKAIKQYDEKLNKENRQGGREVSQRISSNFNEYFNRVSEQNKKPSLSLEGIVRALPYAIEETRISNINLITGGVQAGGKLASAFTDLGGLVKLLNLPELTKPESFQRVGRSIDYVSTVYLPTVQGKLSKIKEEFLKGNQEKVTDINLEIASETIKLMDAQDPKLVRTAEAIAIRSEAMNLIERNKFLQQSQLTEVLDGFDKTYLTTAQVASTIKMITSALAFIAPGKQAVRTFADKADAVNALLFNALQFTYTEDVRKQYELLKAYSNRNQKTISGLSSSIDFSAQEVGQYLTKTRTDVVTRRSDGTISVSVKGVISPP
jgi:hypothetical protein